MEKAVLHKNCFSFGAGYGIMPSMSTGELSLAVRSLIPRKGTKRRILYG